MATGSTLRATKSIMDPAEWLVSNRASFFPLATILGENIAGVIFPQSTCFVLNSNAQNEKLVLCYPNVNDCIFLCCHL